MQDRCYSLEPRGGPEEEFVAIANGSRGPGGRRGAHTRAHIDAEDYREKANEVVDKLD
jgi:hypothetical protein